MTLNHGGLSATEAIVDTASSALTGGKLPTGVTTLLIDGKPVPVTEVVSELATFQSSYEAVRAKRLELQALVQARRELDPELKAFLPKLKTALQAVLGVGSVALAEFGFHPAKTPAPLTGEQIVARKAKAAATRRKRGTLGRRQKAAIRETATPVVTATFPDAPPAPAAPPHPVAGA
jgi:hypothetical protein